MYLAVFPNVSLYIEYQNPVLDGTCSSYMDFLYWTS